MGDNKFSDTDENGWSFFGYWTRRVFTALVYDRAYRGIFPHRPFFTPAAISQIKSILDTDARVFEWGSGLSTLWFARRVKELVSVEHDEAWYLRTRNTLNEQALDSVSLLYRPPSKPAKGFQWEQDWAHFEVLKQPPRKPQFKDYISVIDDFPDSYFDCIVIDGRERLGCTVHATSKLAQQGTLILDDSMRPQYSEIFDLLSEWNVHHYNFGLLQTTLFSR